MSTSIRCLQSQIWNRGILLERCSAIKRSSMISTIISPTSLIRARMMQTSSNRVSESSYRESLMRRLLGVRDQQLRSKENKDTILEEGAEPTILGENSSSSDGSGYLENVTYSKELSTRNELSTAERAKLKQEAKSLLQSILENDAAGNIKDTRTLVQEARSDTVVVPIEMLARPIDLVKKNPVQKVPMRYILCVTFGRNNTHMVLSELYRDAGNPYSLPGQDVRLSMSTGQVGFRKSQRGEAEATYQLAVQFFGRMLDKGFTQLPLELVLRGFSKCRSTFLSVLTGREGVRVRRLINRVTDGTRLRHGGVRPPVRRRI
ncbi:hypothetical protein V1511DRAFT_491231 [Dipodascopsis uninucleata]